MAAPKFVLYHQESGTPKKYAVLKEHDDETVDIGTDGKAVVTSATILKEPKAGCCTAFESKSEKPDKTEK